ncbi:MAG: Formate dehydrogenase putative subunit [Bryobacterales bacterium]|nr:Formate dehydrogenase putative subunit [Bryobacterales bacterium]
MSDGRFIDEEHGILAGEASHQRVRQSQDFPLTPRDETYPHTPTVVESDPTYYDKPVIKQAVWIWSVPAYLYVGGAGGAAMTLGAMAQVAGGWHLRPLVHRCRWIGATGGALSSILLVYDLGRPERFVYMLRVFRPTSPMSIGSWVLTFFGASAGAAAVFSRSGGFLGAVGDMAGLAGGFFGMPLAGYTSVLLSNSAIPVWQEARRSMPFLFIGSAISAAAAILNLFPLRKREARAVSTFAVLGGLLEIAGAAGVERETGAVPQVGRPLNHGVPGTIWKAAKILSTGGLILSMVPKKSRTMRRITGVLGTLGSLCVRFAVFHAGKQSAADPRATFRQQRARLS